MPAEAIYSDYTEVVNDDSEEDSPEVLYECGECGDRHTYASDAENCCVQFSCTECGETWDSEGAAEDCCPPFQCENCGERYHDRYQAQDCCYEEDYGRGTPDLQAVHQVVTAQVEDSYRILIRPLPARVNRVVSVEQELTRGGPTVAALLGELGFSGEYDNTFYDGTPGGVLIKSDGSLPESGGEVVYSMFRLWEPEHSETMSSIVHGIAELRDPHGAVELTHAAGLHIHVSARDDNGGVFSPAHMAALYEIFEWASPLLYPLASLGWQSHRGTDYAKRIQKIRDISPGKIPQTVGADRYLGLNFQRLLQAANNCHCGACRLGDWQACNCGALASGTIEFRLFNATTSARTLHTYLVLALSLTAQATRHRLGSLPEDASLQEIANWLLNECPLSWDERLLLKEQIDRAPFPSPVFA